MKARLLYLKKKIKKYSSRNFLSVVSISLATMIFVMTIISSVSTKNFYNKYLGNRASGSDIIINLKGKNSDIELKKKIESSKRVDSIVSYSQKESDVIIGNKISTMLLINTDIKIEESRGTLSLKEGKLPQSMECLITEAVKNENNLSVGDKLKIKEVEGEREYLISGILENMGTVMKHSFSCIVFDQKLNSLMTPKEYRIKLSENSSLDDSINKIRSKIGLEYAVEKASKNSTDFDKELNAFFNIFYIMAMMILFLGYYLTGITINFYIEKIRKEISVLKVLGMKGKDIFLLLGDIGVFLTSIGSLIGIILGILSSRIMISLIEGLLKTKHIPIIISYKIILLSALVSILIGYIVSITLSKKILKETIIDGLNEKVKVTNHKTKGEKINFLIMILVFLINVILYYSKASVLYLILVQTISIVMLIILIIHIFLEKFILKLTKKCNFIPEYSSLMVKNNFMKNKKKVQRSTIFITIVITLILGISSTGNQFHRLLDNLIDYSYFGDIVLSSSSGSTITNKNIENVKKTNMVLRIYPLYQRYFNYRNVKIQVNGYEIDKTIENQLKKYLNLKNDDLAFMKESNNALVSVFVLDKCDLKVGDTIKVGDKDFKIKGSYNSMINDGKSMIINKKDFLLSNEDYKIRHANLILKNKVKFSKFKEHYQEIDKDPNISVRSIQQAKEREKKVDNQFMYIIYGMIISIFFANILMIINSVLSEIKENEKTINILKKLGIDRKQISKHYISDMFIKSVFSSTVAIVFSNILNWVFVNNINSYLHWNLIFKVEYRLLTLIWIIFIVLNIMITSIIVRKTYKNS